MTTWPSAGRIMRRTIGGGVLYRTVRTLPSPKTNCGPAGRRRAPVPAAAALAALRPARAGREVGEVSSAASRGRARRRTGPVPPVPPMTYRLVPVPAAGRDGAARLIAFSPKKIVFDVPSVIEPCVDDLAPVRAVGGEEHLVVGGVVGASARARGRRRCSSSPDRPGRWRGRAGPPRLGGAACSRS